MGRFIPAPVRVGEQLFRDAGRAVQNLHGERLNRLPGQRNASFGDDLELESRAARSRIDQSPPELPCKIVDEGAFVRGRDGVIDQTPVPLVERKRLPARDVWSLEIPAQQLEVGVFIDSDHASGHAGPAVLASLPLLRRWGRLSTTVHGPLRRSTVRPAYHAEAARASCLPARLPLPRLDADVASQVPDEGHEHGGVPVYLYTVPSSPSRARPAPKETLQWTAPARPGLRRGVDQPRAAMTVISTRVPGARTACTQARWGQLSGPPIHSHHSASISALCAMSVR